jgi:hypothetical protein
MEATLSHAASISKSAFASISPQNSHSRRMLSPGAIAGIVIRALAVVLGGAFAVSALIRFASGVGGRPCRLHLSRRPGQKTVMRARVRVHRRRSVTCWPDRQPKSVTE